MGINSGEKLQNLNYKTMDITHGGGKKLTNNTKLKLNYSCEKKAAHLIWTALVFIIRYLFNLLSGYFAMES